MSSSIIESKRTVNANSKKVETEDTTWEKRGYNVYNVSISARYRYH